MTSRIAVFMILMLSPKTEGDLETRVVSRLISAMVVMVGHGFSFFSFRPFTKRWLVLMQIPFTFLSPHFRVVLTREENFYIQSRRCPMVTLQFGNRVQRLLFAMVGSFLYSSPLVDWGGSIPYLCATKLL